ncbi:MAG TPA: AraC family transcriptional regulator [Azospirillaceae bacterium]|nr:AraC family transcriptional regulator [Azospirillaceae bacterium]
MAREIGFVLFEGVTALDLTGPMDVFATANEHAAAAGDRPPYRLEVLAADCRPCRAESGLVLLPGAAFGEGGRFDTVLVPGGAGLRDAETGAAVAAWLAAQAATARRLASVCTGIYAMAAAGLLDGRRATTHWRFVADLMRRHPSIRLQPGARVVADGRFRTSGGVTAGIDLALALVGEDLGPAAADAVARELDLRPGAVPAPVPA